MPTQLQLPFNPAELETQLVFQFWSAEALYPELVAAVSSEALAGEMEAEEGEVTLPLPFFGQELQREAGQ